ncbi:MAG: hypothetical protein HRU06_07810 [Oceanospirillaceae bacterium]|nr:hypothetical protein [Oceanospirillaceae bacterium]
MTTNIEIVTFKLLPTVNEQQLVSTNAAMETFLNDQPGFLYRSLSSDGEGTWFDIIYWKDQQCAAKAATAFDNSSICQQMMPLIDLASCKKQNMPALSEILAKELAA